MNRKTKAFWIGFLAPVVTVCVVLVASFASAAMGGQSYVLSSLGFSSRSSGLLGALLFTTGPPILLGGLVALIAYFCTSGPPMDRRGKAAWIGFFVPVILSQGLVLCGLRAFFIHGHGSVGIGTAVMLFSGGPSILLGGVIAFAIANTMNKDRDPLKCVGCGYSLVGLTGDKCPECGKKTP